jgi:hypothetical protein
MIGFLEEANERADHQTKALLRMLTHMESQAKTEATMLIWTRIAAIGSIAAVIVTILVA